jgi:hypothetical protein
MSTRWTLKDIEQVQAKQKNCKNTVENSATLKADTQINCKNTINNQPASFALGRLKSGEMNKTEIAYANYLNVLKKAGEVIWFEFEPMNLRLADKCFYAVDFLVMLKNGQLECHEVKGYWTDDALVKIKTAAEKFPFRFISVRLVKGSWEIREF